MSYLQRGFINLGYSSIKVALQYPGEIRDEVVKSAWNVWVIFFHVGIRGEFWYWRRVAENDPFPSNITPNYSKLLTNSKGVLKNSKGLWKNRSLTCLFACCEFLNEGTWYNEKDGQHSQVNLDLQSVANLWGNSDINIGQPALQRRMQIPFGCEDSSFAVV